MKKAKHRPHKQNPVPLLPWVAGDLVRYYKMHGAGTGWQLCKVVRVGDKETTVHKLGHPRIMVTLPHSEFSTELPK